MREGDGREGLPDGAAGVTGVGHSAGSASDVGQSMRADSTAQRDRSEARGQLAAPAINLPKGGGAIRGIGETFKPNPFTGTGSLSVPLYTSPGRSGFQPQLALSYSSGGGNGPFGLGWALSVPAVSRKTEKKLPEYHDAIESDTYLLSGAEDLVPVYVEPAAGGRPRFEERRAFEGSDYVVHRYRPRTEGLFARIERWTRIADGDIHWRSISKENITSVYGRDPQSRIADPNDTSRVFSWLLEESYDAKGNVIAYEYVAEDLVGVDRRLLYEAHRVELTQQPANKYLKRILYGNHEPYKKDNWYFEVVFDYGDHGGDVPSPSPDQSWPARPDAFSVYRAGFEIRTRRLCRRVLMFHHFPAELGRDAYLVKSTDFDFHENPVGTYLKRVVQRGYRLREDGQWVVRSMPPLELEYTHAFIDGMATPQALDDSSLENLPQGVEGSLYRFIDLDGEGAAGVLSEQAGEWWYKRWDGPARFGPLERIAPLPSMAALSRGAQQLADLDGDGLKSLVQYTEPLAGYQERTAEGGWEPFVEFKSLPNIDWRDPNLQFIDLNGDGYADLLIAEDHQFVWYPSKSREGFEAPRYYQKPQHEDEGPVLVFADVAQSIHLADMSGDGQTDLVRIRHGEVCYWPNLGHGRFGARVAMSHAIEGSFFAPQPEFDSGRIRLVDIDGSGTTDIIYLGSERVEVWLNQSGNALSAPIALENVPPPTNAESVQATDLHGNGTAGLVWSSPLPNGYGRQMQHVDLVGAIKPHLLVAVRNNLGAETRVRYAPSTKFYLEDRKAGRPWITRLHFPVHVIERVETHDWINGTRLISTYRYHHGYFDGHEREFRGFGMVEQEDAESLLTEAQTGLFGGDGDNVEHRVDLPPVLTRTWFHTGAFLDREHISLQYRREYFDGDPEQVFLPDTVLPPHLDTDEVREACRALRGQALRQEVYSLEGKTALAADDVPYTVTESNYTVERVQARHDNRYAVFFAHARETLSYHYERNASDPRLAHQAVLAVDDYGNALEAVAIGYARRAAHLPSGLNMPDWAEDLLRVDQARTWITHTKTSVTDAIDDDDAHHAPLPCEVLTYELTGIAPAHAGVFTFAELECAIDPADSSEIPFHSEPTGGAERRLVDATRTLFYLDDASGPADFGKLAARVLPYESYKLALTPGLVDQVFGADVDDALLRGEGAYVLGNEIHAVGDAQRDAGWWVPSGRVLYRAADTAGRCEDRPNPFFLPLAHRDPFSGVTCVGYDDYDLLITAIEDPVGNLTRAANDYRVLQPREVADANDNRTQVAVDALGLVVASAVAVDDTGDALDIEADLGATSDDDHARAVDNYLADPIGAAQGLLGKSTTRLIYDVHRYRRTRQHEQDGTERGEPPVVATLARETHVATLGAGEQTRIQRSFSYSDGLGREVQTKVQAEPGEVDGAHADPRWVGSGWTVFNNKGDPVEQYEPFFAATHGFEFDRRAGVHKTLFYDPLQRAVLTLNPNRSYEKVVYDPWRQETWDANDTVLGDPRTDVYTAPYVGRYLPQGDAWKTWLQIRISDFDPDNPPPAPDNEQAAALKASRHASTPASMYLDSLGRSVLAIASNGYTPDEQYATHTLLDVEGDAWAITDAINRCIMRYTRDFLGTELHQRSVDAGERQQIANAAGNPLRLWLPEGEDDAAAPVQRYTVRTVYDAGQRPVEVWVRLDEGAERLDVKTEYGEGVADDKQNNLRGQVFRLYDGAGRVTNTRYDAKGNLLHTQRHLRERYDSEPHWADAEPLEADSYATDTTYDALNRPLTVLTPDDSITRYQYNEAGLLEAISANLYGAAEATDFVRAVAYNARGQRESIAYAIKDASDQPATVTTTYRYDSATFRLTDLKTKRDTDAKTLQHLLYTYDPVGNITQLDNRADNTLYFANAAVGPDAHYDYDPIYRLIRADGREHVANGTPTPIGHDDGPRLNIPMPADWAAIQRYTQEYHYDAVGNFREFVHRTGTLPPGGGLPTGAVQWRRSYEQYAGSNRIRRATLGGEPAFEYRFDRRGNMIAMPHLPTMAWNHKNQLIATSRQVVNPSPPPEKVPETTYYQYDASGMRVRKITVDQNGNPKSRRIYIGPYEIYKEFKAGGVERQSLSVMDDKSRVALVEKESNENPLIRYQGANHLQSVAIELNHRGEPTNLEEYYPYGATSHQLTRGSAVAATKRYRCFGKERDCESELVYFGARYYAAYLSRWMNPDPFESTSDVNRYEYVRSNPIKHVDAHGMQSKDVNAMRPPVLVDDDSKSSEVHVPDFRIHSPSPIYFERFSTLQSLSVFKRDPGQTPRNDLIDIYEILASLDPQSYRGNVYTSILPDSTSKSNIVAAATNTPDDPVSNRTRWALQISLVAYMIEYGAPELNTPFVYEWHDFAFRFSGDSPAIGKLPWALLNTVDVPGVGESIARHTVGLIRGLGEVQANVNRGVMDPSSLNDAFNFGQQLGALEGRRIGGEFIGWTIHSFNQPDGTIPAWAIPLRMAIDAISAAPDAFYGEYVRYALPGSKDRGE